MLCWSPPDVLNEFEFSLSSFHIFCGNVKTCTFRSRIWFLPVRHEGGIKEVHYRLRSVVLHSGSAISGHYIAMVFHDTDADKVTVYYDQIVKDISLEGNEGNAKTSCYPGRVRSP